MCGCSRFKLWWWSKKSMNLWQNDQLQMCGWNWTGNLHQFCVVPEDWMQVGQKFQWWSDWSFTFRPFPTDVVKSPSLKHHNSCHKKHWSGSKVGFSFQWIHKPSPRTGSAPPARLVARQWCVSDVLVARQWSVSGRFYKSCITESNYLNMKFLRSDKVHHYMGYICYIRAQSCWHFSSTCSWTIQTVSLN